MVDRSGILAAVRRLEEELLGASERIRDIGPNDSLADWLIEVLRKDTELSRQFALPTKQTVTKALLTLLGEDSSLRTPLVTLLAQRTSAFIATIREIAAHPYSSPRMEVIEQNTKDVVDLLTRYEVNYDRRKTIPLVAESLQEHRTHIYKISPQESDLRVALRAFYEDDDRDDEVAINYLLEFALQELLEEVRRPGHLPQPRHAWWAVEILFCEGQVGWLKAKRPSLNKVVSHLLSQVRYTPSREVDYTSFVPELHSTTNEDLWMAINGCRMLSSGRAWLLSEENATGIVERVKRSVSGVLSAHQQYSNLKLTQSRLILLYEMLIYADIQRALEMATASRLDLSGARLGDRYYDASVTNQFAEIGTAIEGLLGNTARWTRGTLSAMLLSSSPGQGKSELARQIIKEIRPQVAAAGFQIDVAELAIGKEINSESDLSAALDWVGENGTVYCRFFDEVDKAEFDFYSRFLALLETENDPRGRTIWLFAQSTQPTFEDLKQHAESTDLISMRDFLTRIQLGWVDIPNLQFSAEQKVYSALGMAKQTDSKVRKVQRELILDLTQRADIRTNRDILGIVTKEYEVGSGVLRMKRDPTFHLTDYLIGPKRVAARKSPLPLRI